MENDQKREGNKDMKNSHNSSKTIMLLFIKYSSALPRTGAYNLNFLTLLLILQIYSFLEPCFSLGTLIEMFLPVTGLL